MNKHVSLVLFLLAVLAYVPTLRNGFIWDDDTLVTKNQWVTHPNALRGLTAIWTGEQSPDYFPLTSTSFWLEWRLWGDFPAGFHLTNVLLHAAGVVLVWKILARLGASNATAALAAALFAVHPVNVESVAWIAERKNTLSLVFYLLSILAWLRSRASAEPRLRRRQYALALACFIAALLSKTSTVMLPFVLLLLAWWQESCAISPSPDAPSPDPSSPKRKFRKSDARTPAPAASPASARWHTLLQTLLQAAPFFAAALGLGLLTIHFQTAQGLNPDTLNRPADVRIAQAGVNLWFYLYKTLLPIDLATVYPEARLEQMSALSFVPLALWILLLAALWHMRKNAAARHCFAGLAFFTLNLGPVLGILNMAWTAISPVGDHFLYIPMLGIVPLLAAGGVRLASARLGRPGLMPRVMTALAALVAVAMTFSCWGYASVYRSMLDLWAFNTRVRPTSGFAFYDYGLGFKFAGKPDEAAVQFKRATELSPRLIAAHFELGQYLFAQKRYHEAMEEFQAVLNIVPRHRDAFLYYVESLWRSGDLPAATAMYTREIASHPSDAVLVNAYGLMLEANGMTRQALDQYRNASAIDPNYASSYFNAGNCLLALNLPEEAADAYRAAVDRDPQRSDAWFNLALALRTLGKNEDADAALRTAVALNPSLAATQPAR